MRNFYYYDYCYCYLIENFKLISHIEFDFNLWKFKNFSTKLIIFDDSYAQMGLQCDFAFILVINYYLFKDYIY